ncbi:MAG: hypothetical protein AMS27_12850 [Bacteroides sp. SM23_62_1]|nr:MAG: hypothetical protein AMS27_12850 [Bacteroides sp. SM23_62_1]
MKTKIILLFLLLISISLVNAQDTIFFQNFDDYPGEKPPGWTGELEVGESKWQFVNGGGTKTPEIPASRKPPSAYSGTVNALYFYESLQHESVILVTPPINLTYAVKPELRFQHAQMEGNLGPGLAHDELRVYYKTHFDSTWTEARKIGEYTDVVSSWTEQTILIPEGAFVDSCYFGFKATTNYGWGVCIDDVSVLETGELTRYVDTVTIHQENTNFIPGGSKNNPVLRINISVKGNTDEVILDSIKVKSLNSSDNDIPANGVKLFYKYASKNFYAAVPYDTVSFSSGAAHFSGLNLSLPTGNTSLWITCDIKEEAVHGNHIDLLVDADDININGNTYPSSAISPAGERIIREAVFFDDFSTDMGWTFSGDFERNRPHGYGGNFIGNPDPEYAAGDTMIIGNDLTGLGFIEGDYEPNVARYVNLATSPSSDLFYYNDVKLSFLRWLNVENSDTASVEMSTDGGSSWIEVWSNNNSVFTDNDWKFFSLNLSEAHRQSNVMLRINLGPTNANNHFSGWNIENLAITGNYVEYDVSPTALLSPGNGCGHSSTETVSIKVRNFGPGATPSKIPVRYSFNGGTTWTTDTITSAIPFDDETTFDFSQTVDLSAPGTYNVIIETILDVDEEATNNIFDTVLYIDPTYSIPYTQNFESGKDFWRADGTNASWAHGTPAATIINTAASGTKAWVTKLTGNYNDLEDSWIMGPCFDFSGIDYPVFECKLFLQTENDSDGVMLEYSLDNAETWTRLGSEGDGEAWGWNWYNSDSIKAVEGDHGWTGFSPGWITSRIFLDTLIFRNFTGVKFRFHFSSDSFNRYEGIGIDDIRIYDAPRDVGVISIESPVTACAQDIGDHVAVTIQNFGLDTLMTGETIIVGYDFDGKPTVTESFQLESDVVRNGTFQYTFKRYIAVTTSGTKEVKAFTLLPDDIRFYNEITTNDTASKSIDVELTPFVFLPPVIYTVRPDTVVLDAYTGNPTDEYLWQDTSTDSVFHVTVKADGVYHVRAYNDLCYYRDTTYIYHLIADAGATEINQPVSDCELGSSVLPGITIKNFGTDTMHLGDQITAGYIVDSEPAVEEVIVLDNPVYPDSTFEYIFSTPADFTDIKTYSLKAYTVLTDDDSTFNDTTDIEVEVYGITEIDLGPDVVVRTLTYTIDPGSGYNTYLWQDGSTSQTLIVDSTGQYSVTVTEGTRCENSDTVHVTIIIPDIAIRQIYSPASACGLSSTENLDLYIKNVGSDTLKMNDTIPLTYQINSGTVIFDTVFIDRTVLNGDSILFTSSGTVDLNTPDDYQFLIIAHYGKDLIPANDTIDQTIQVWGFPTVSLGSDMVIYISDTTLDAGAGMSAYLWQDGSTDRYYTVNYQNQSPDHTYSVIVTDTNSCQGSDEIQVTFDIYDIGISRILTPVSACTLSDLEELKIRIKNFGTRTIFNEKIQIVAIVNSKSPVFGQKTITTAMVQGDSLDFSFGSRFDLSAEGDHTFRVYTIYDKDFIATNDTTDLIISHWGYPAPDLGGINDTLNSALPYLFEAGSGYDQYIWNGIPGSHQLSVSEYGWYKVIVIDIHGCQGEDSVYLAPPTGIHDLENLGSNLLVYPNPTDHQLYIELILQDYIDLWIELFDATGRKIIIKELRQVNGIHEAMNVSGLPEGVYYLKIRTKEGQVLRKIVVF